MSYPDSGVLVAVGVDGSGVLVATGVDGSGVLVAIGVDGNGVFVAGAGTDDDVGAGELSGVLVVGCTSVGTRDGVFVAVCVAEGVPASGGMRDRAPEIMMGR
jgi:hypothetical protein